MYAKNYIYACQIETMSSSNLEYGRIHYYNIGYIVARAKISLQRKLMSNAYAPSFPVLIAGLALKFS